MRNPLFPPMLVLVCFMQMASITATGLSQERRQITFTGKTMGPIDYRVIVGGDLDQKQEQDIETAIAAELDAVNQLMSTYIETSEVSRFNRSTSTDWFPVSRATLAVIQRGLEISRASEGAFDFTVGPLVNLWKFGPDKEQPRIPDQNEIDQLLQSVGFDKIETQASPPAIKKSLAGVQIDLSAIAKGFAVDQVARKLLALGVDSYLVEVGGEVACRGVKVDGEDWRVGIEQPNEDTRKIRRSLSLHDKALASSGDYRNYYMIDGKRYSHTIDPRSGWPVQNDVAATSVIADDCTTADAVATALMVLGPSKGIELAERLNVEALIVSRSGNELSEVQTPGFPAKPAAAQPWVGAFLGAAIVFGLAIAAMSVGVIFGNLRLRGSCGGIASLENGAVTPECSLCSAPSKQCRQVKKAIKDRSLAAGADDTQP